MTPPIFLLGESMGANEVAIGKGFVGASGIELLRMLGDAGVIELTSIDRDYIYKFFSTGNPLLIDSIWQLHPEVYRSNVFQQHPLGNDILSFCGGKAEGIAGYPALSKSKYVRAEFEPELERLSDELVTINPNLIVCLGNTPLWALAGRVGVSKLRGTTCVSTHTASGFKLLPTYHPAAVLRQWDNRPVAVADLIKAKAQSLFPEIRRPKREIWIEPSVADVERFINDHIPNGSLVSVDIETSGTRITCIGLAPSSALAIVIPFDDERTKSRSYWPTKDSEFAVWKLIEGVLRNPRIRKTFQNGLYDIAFLWRAVGIGVMGAEHDTMLLHHALQPESLKGLAFLGSIYADEGAWKQERKTDTIKRDE